MPVIVTGFFPSLESTTQPYCRSRGVYTAPANKKEKNRGN